jgi:hypothetical protein
MTTRPKSIEAPKRLDKEREARISKAVCDLLDLEEKCGHNAVFAAFKKWMNKPLRGKF